MPTRPNRPTRLFLFDVDGTLVDSGGAGRRAMTRTFAEVFGVADAFQGIEFSGRTDPSIIREAMQRTLGRATTPDEDRGFLARYMALLRDEVAATDRYRVLPGVPRLVEGLASRPDCLLGLCTGNYEEGARIKLERAGLNAFFGFGGYASDSEDRAVLTGLSWQRGLALAGQRGDGPSVGATTALVIGDSPLDARAARANGLPFALVASGWTSAGDLRAEQPDLFFDSFDDWGAGIARLLGTGDGLRAGIGDVERAADCVRAGGVIAYPTATLYGLGGDALDPAVAARVRAIKGGREAPFIVLAEGIEAALALTRAPSATTLRLANAFWPGPLTLVLPAAGHIPAHAIGPDGTIAVRVDAHPFARALAARAGVPILSTSANRSGEAPPGAPDDVPDRIVAACDLFVVDDQPLAGRPSTVARVTGDVVEILREGAVKP